MKVWELMKQLSEYFSGADVDISVRFNNTCIDVPSIVAYKNGYCIDIACELTEYEIIEEEEEDEA